MTDRYENIRELLKERDACASAPPSATVGVEAYLVERLGGEGYGNTRSIIDAAFYDPTKPAFWSSPEAQARHRVTPLVPALAQQPAAVDEAMVERATMALLGKSHDPAPGVDWVCNRTWTVNYVRERMRAALIAAQQPEVPRG